MFNIIKNGDTRLLREPARRLFNNAQCAAVEKSKIAHESWNRAPVHVTEEFSDCDGEEER